LDGFKVSPTFDYSTQQQKPQKVKEQALDVQVTKENLKQYSHNVAPSAFGIVPGRNSYPIGYVDYDFAKARPSSAPSTLTYEVSPLLVLFNTSLTNNFVGY